MPITKKHVSKNVAAVIRRHLDRSVDTKPSPDPSALSPELGWGCVQNQWIHFKDAIANSYVWLESEVVKRFPQLHRDPTVCIRAYVEFLEESCTGLDHERCTKFVKDYERARFSQAEYTFPEYMSIMENLGKILDSVRAPSFAPRAVPHVARTAASTPSPRAARPTVDVAAGVGASFPITPLSPKSPSASSPSAQPARSASSPTVQPSRSVSTPTTPAVTPAATPFRHSTTVQVFEDAPVAAAQSASASWWPDEDDGSLRSPSPMSPTPTPPASLATPATPITPLPVVVVTAPAHSRSEDAAYAGSAADGGREAVCDQDHQAGNKRDGSARVQRRRRSGERHKPAGQLCEPAQGDASRGGEREGAKSVRSRRGGQPQ